MKHTQFIVALFIISAVAAISFASSQQQTVSATVSVTCPLSASITPNAVVFAQPFNVVLLYSANTQVQCSATGATGSLSVTNAINNQVFYTNTIDLGTLTQSQANGIFTFNSLLSGRGLDTAIITISSQTQNAQSTTQFHVLSPANITISSMSASPSNPNIGTTMSLTVNAVNSGDFASSNTVINLLITSPGFSYNTIEPISDLSPQQSEVVSFSFGSIAPSAGTYTILANVSYQSTVTVGNSVYTTNVLSQNYTTTYTVSSPSHGGGTPAPTTTSMPPVTSIGTIVFEQQPLFTSLYPGNSTIRTVSFTNTGNAPVWVNITLPQSTYGTFGATTKSIFMFPNQTGIIQVLFTPNINTQNISFVIPLNFTITAVGARSFYGQLFLQYSVTSNDTDQLNYLSRTTLVNNSKGVAVQFTVSNPTNITYYNVVLTTLVPQTSLLANNKITLSGAFGNVTTVNNQYVLQWRIPTLLPQGSVQVSYQIANVLNPAYFYAPSTSITTISPRNVTGVKVFGISIPTFYVGKPGAIRVSAIYVGSNVTNVTFSLVPSGDVTVRNRVQTYQVYPNTYLNVTFNIAPIFVSGTEIFQLNVQAPQSNQSFTIPAFVVQGQNASQSQNGVSGAGTTLSDFQRGVALTVIGSVILLFILWYIIYKKVSGAFPDRQRMEKMMRLRERVKRDY